MKKTTLTKKLIKFILPLLVFPIFLLSFFYYQYLTHLLTNEIIDLSKSTLNESDEYLQNDTITDTLLRVTIIDKELNIILDSKQKNNEPVYALDDKFLSEYIQEILDTKKMNLKHFEKRKFIIKPLLNTKDEIVAFSIVEYSYLLEKKLATVHQTFLYIVFIIIFIVFISIILTIIFSYSVTHSIKLLIEESRRVIKGDLSHKIEVSSNDEVGELVESFNIMIEKRRDVESNLEKKEKKLQELNKKLESKVEIAVDKSNKLSERLELALLGNHDGIWDWNIVDNSLYYSSRWKEMLGYSDDELPNEYASWETNVHPDDLEETYAGLQKNIDGETEYYEGTHRMKHKNGSWVWILDRGKAIFDDTGKAVRMIGTHTDITKQKNIELELIDKKRDFQAIYEGSKEAIAILDEESNFLQVNDAYMEMTGMSEEELLATSCIALSAPEDVERSIKIVGIVLESGFIKDYEKRCRLKDGSYVSVNMSISRLDNPTRLLISVRDVTKQKEAEDKLKEQKNILHYQAHHDALTGLPNRTLLNDRLEQAIEKAKRSKTSMALLFIDLDHFKEINDSLGHEMGDKVLTEVTQKLKETIRDEDTLARLGGDEFTIILEGIAEGHDASVLAQKLLKVLSKPLNIEGHELYVSSSIGISLYPDDGTSAQNLLKYADSAMYKAKDNGRNSFQFYSAEMTELAFEKVVMEAALRSAVINEEFVVYYQAQVDAPSNKLIGMEALVRWQHPTMGMISPDKFIPLAERTGLIVELDRLVMKIAMNQITEWYKKGLDPGSLAINLAVKQLKKDDFIEMFKKMMKEIECKPEWLEFEVTEGQIMTNPEEAVKILKQISDLGIELAIDDFGTGYSSLSYLKKLPIDKLKIDQSFVRDLPDDEEDAGITKAVIALAKSLNLKIIAEGVETKEQKEFLVKHGCNNIQGYYYSKPISADKMEVILLHGFK